MNSPPVYVIFICDAAQTFQVCYITNGGPHLQIRSKVNGKESFVDLILAVSMNSNQQSLHPIPTSSLCIARVQTRRTVPVHLAPPSANPLQVAGKLCLTFSNVFLFFTFALALASCRTSSGKYICALFIYCMP